jgi:hypothetical protein
MGGAAARREAIDRQDVREVQRRIEWLRKAAERVDVLAAGAKSPFWRDHLEPLLAASVQDFTDSVWTMKPEEFAARREAARALRDFRDFAAGAMGRSRDELLADAVKLADSLEQAVRHGRIPAALLEEGAA